MSDRLSWTDFYTEMPANHERDLPVMTLDYDLALSWSSVYGIDRLWTVLVPDPRAHDEDRERRVFQIAPGLTVHDALYYVVSTHPLRQEHTGVEVFDY